MQVKLSTVSIKHGNRKGRTPFKMGGKTLMKTALRPYST